MTNNLGLIWKIIGKCYTFVGNGLLICFFAKGREKQIQITSIKSEFNCMNRNNFKRILDIGNLRIFKSCEQAGDSMVDRIAIKP